MYIVRGKKKYSICYFVGNDKFYFTNEGLPLVDCLKHSFEWNPSIFEPKLRPGQQKKWSIRWEQ